MEHPFTTPLKDMERFFEDPRLGEEFSMMMRSFQSQVNEGFVRSSAAANISMGIPSTSGQEDFETSLQEFLAPLLTEGLAQLVPRGTIVAFHGTWEAAQSQVGWNICDGTNGTPKIHPGPQDVVKVQRFLRAGARETSSGGVGGASVHTHDDHLWGALIDAIANHADHTHLYSGVVCACTSCTFVQTAAAFATNAFNHSHCICNQETDANGGAGHTEAGGPGCYEHSSANHTPPYVDMIFLMKE